MYNYQSIAERKNKPKELLKFINSVIPSKPSSTSTSFPKLKINNSVVENPKNIFQHFNDYLTKIGSKIAESVESSNKNKFTAFLTKFISQSIVLDFLSPVEIYNTINSLNPHKTCGPDDISFFLLRMGNELLAPILSIFFNYTFELSLFPQIFKVAKVIPIYKSENKDLVNNYPPISLLSSLSKVLEKLIKTRFVNLFEKHDVFCDYQYGFRKKNNDMIHALLDVTTLGFYAVQNRNYTALVLIDLRKAFNTLSHEIMQKNYIIMA